MDNLNWNTAHWNHEMYNTVPQVAASAKQVKRWREDANVDMQNLKLSRGGMNVTSTAVSISGLKTSQLMIYFSHMKPR